jgi:ABC-2 type transport system ATP-binding protein
MFSITTRDLTRCYGKLVAVDHLNLKIPTGSLFGLIGPNGAGKTTTLRMLAGLLEPSSGEIRVNELSTKQYWNEIQWQIGFMPDFFGVYEDLLVWEYLDFFARCYKLEKKHRQQITAELLELVDLSEKRDAFVHTLSRGMRQRLCLAHALIHDPQVLLLDEPASGLDPRARVEMRELLRELRNMGKTILLSSHILTELAELCDHVAIMERGKLVISAPIEEILRRAREHRRFTIQVLDNTQRLEEILRSSPAVHDISYEDNQNRGDRIEIEFSGDDQAAADLLESLVAQKVRVAAFGELDNNLEEAFLRLTKGEVA